MTNLEKTLTEMASNKNIKAISFEWKRMSNGIKLTYETRIGDETKMGLEFVNAKDFEDPTNGLNKAVRTMIDKIYETCIDCKDEVVA